jgi:phosphocarrier protein HPr
VVQAEVTVKLLNKVGLHARPAALFVQTANKFKSNIVVEKEGKEVYAKSILNILSIGAEYGSVITIKADGDDGEMAVKTLFELVKNKFYEE